MSAREDFGSTLSQSRRRWALTQADLANKIGLARGSVAHWEQGRRLPNREQILHIADVLKLSVTETEELLAKAGYPSLNMKDADILFGGPGPKSSTESDVVSNAAIKNLDAAREMQIQIKDLQDSVVSLRDIIESLPESIADGVGRGQPGEQGLSLIEETQNILKTLKDLQSTSREIYAPVSIPSPEQMRVPLVPSTFVERIEEYRSEQNIWFSLAGVFLGALLGLTSNLVTGGRIESSTVVAMIIVLIMVLMTGVSALKYKRRADKLRDQMLGK